jgi:hypothetical protein
MNTARICCLLIAIASTVFGAELPSLTAQSFASNGRLALGTESNKSASVRIGDLDKDGDLDVVVGNGRHWPQQNYAFLNQGRSRFNVMKPIGSERSTTYACELADLDGDGDLDIATGNDMAPCKIFLNDGNANFTFKTNFGGLSSVRSMTIADIDRDGDQDIILTCRGRANQIYLNDGKANFGKGIEFGTKSDSTIDVEVGDVNGDGHSDLLLANRDGQPNAWLLDDGSFKFDQRLPFGNPKSNSRAVTVGDFNSDGHLDWAVGNIDAANQLFLGDGKGGIIADVKFGQDVGRTYCLSSADVDLDGDLDLVAGNAGQANTFFLNNGDGSSFRQEVFNAEPNATYGLSLGDLNGDGMVDIAVANSDATNQIFLGRRSVKQAEDEQSKQTGLNGPRLAKFHDRADYRSANWPAFRGTGARGVAEGFSLPMKWNADSKSGDQKNVLWQIDVPGLGHSSPVIMGDKLFLLTAVAKDGSAPLQVQSGGKPTAADDNGEQDWILLCYDKSNGTEIWKQTLRQGTPRATRHAKATHANTSVCVSGAKVITFLGSEGLYCHNLDGKLMWSQDLGVINISKYGIGWGFSSSPSVHDDKIVLVCDDPENPFLTCRNLSDGKEVWRTSRKDICERSWGTPLVHQHNDETQVVVNGWPWIVSYRLSDGKELWRIEGGGDNPVPSPFEANGLIYITNAHGGPAPIHAVRPTARGELKVGDNDSFAWSVGKGGSYMSTPVVYGDQIYLGQTRGVVRTFDAGTGEKLGERRLGSKAGVIASLVAGDGKIYCAAENGVVYVLEQGPELKILSENRMDSPCLATPAISQGTIFVRTTKQLTAIAQNNDSSRYPPMP